MTVLCYMNTLHILLLLYLITNFMFQPTGRQNVKHVKLSERG